MNKKIKRIIKIWRKIMNKSKLFGRIAALKGWTTLHFTESTIHISRKGKRFVTISIDQKGAIIVSDEMKNLTEDQVISHLKETLELKEGS